jgi:hypothetical protein
VALLLVFGRKIGILSATLWCFHLLRGTHWVELHESVVVQMLVAAITVYGAFLVGQGVESHSRTGCRVLSAVAQAAFLQGFALAMLETWMAYRSLTQVNYADLQQARVRKLSYMAWCLPAGVIVVLTLVLFEDFGEGQLCFVEDHVFGVVGGLIVAMVLGQVLILQRSSTLENEPINFRTVKRPVGLSCLMALVWAAAAGYTAHPAESNLAYLLVGLCLASAVYAAVSYGLVGRERRQDLLGAFKMGVSHEGGGDAAVKFRARSSALPTRAAQAGPAGGLQRRQGKAACMVGETADRGLPACPESTASNATASEAAMEDAAGALNAYMPRDSNADGGYMTILGGDVDERTADLLY